MKRGAQLVLAIAAFVVPGGILGQPTDTGDHAAGGGPTEIPNSALFASATEAYQSALDTKDRDARIAGFRRAMLFFDEIIARGIENSELYANLGNAALQSERLGTAILAYRRALLLDPDHERAGENLEHARSLLPSWVPRPEGSTLLDTFFFWHRTLSTSERLLLGAALFLIAAALASAAIRWRLAWPRNLAILPAAGWLALSISLGVDLAADHGSEAVVTADEVFARTADSPGAPAQFSEPLPAGAELIILEVRADWAHVRLMNGRDAWLPIDAIAVVEPR